MKIFWSLVIPPKMLLHLDRFLHKEKVSGPEGNTLFYDLAERALDAQVSERVKDYISQVMEKELLLHLLCGC